LRVSLGETKHMNDTEIVFLVTGSQGESRAALMQMSTQSYKGLSIEPGDTVVLSARIIPGNERSISRMIGFIYKRGANIIEEKRRLIHVSGHASQEDIKIMTEAVKPKFVVPIHGEYRMLFRHKEFVKNHLGYREENVILIENGDVLELDGERAAIIDKREIKRTFIGDSNFDEIEQDVIRERRQLANDGILTPVITINSATGELELPPEVLARGVVGFDGLNGLMAGAKDAVIEAVESASRAELADTTLLKERVRLGLKRYVQKKTGSRPVISTVVVEV